MKRTFIIAALAAVTFATLHSCTIVRAGGTDTGMGVSVTGSSINRYDLIPVGDRITYTIDISTPEGRQKLKNITVAEAKQLAEVEASRKYNCDRLIDPRFDFLRKGKNILRVTIDGRPGNYRMKEDEKYDLKTRQEIDINVRH